jgi:hypothetical protein
MEVFGQEISLSSSLLDIITKLTINMSRTSADVEATMTLLIADVKSIHFCVDEWIIYGYYFWNDF